MANEPSGSSNEFDLRTIRQLVKLMNENDLAEIDLRNASQRVRLRKRGSEVVPVASTVPTVLATALETAAAAGQAAPPRSAPSEPIPNYVEIKSPMLGTFYRASAPDAEPFVQVGSHVDADTVVCIIEAMKVFNEITADCRGKIVAILVESSRPVEYGQALFRVDPTG